MGTWGGQLQGVQPFQMAPLVQQFQIGMKGGEGDKGGLH